MATPTPAPTLTPIPEDDSGGFSGGAVPLAVGGVAVILIAAGAYGFYLYRQRQG